MFTEILFIYFQTSLPWAECPTEIIGNISVPVAECAKSSETSYFWYREALGKCILRKINFGNWKKNTWIFFLHSRHFRKYFGLWWYSRTNVVMFSIGLDYCLPNHHERNQIFGLCCLFHSGVSIRSHDNIFYSRNNFARSHRRTDAHV